MSRETIAEEAFRNALLQRLDALIERLADKPKPKPVLEEAARAIVHQRDYGAEHTHYDSSTFHPEPDQMFDDWAADILEAALKGEGK